MKFVDRDDAGRQLAELVAASDEVDPVVLALPRGGVPVGVPIARRLGAPLDVILVRKLGAPGNPELAIGAIGECGVRVVEHDVALIVGATADDLARAEAAQRLELARRAERYRAVRPRVAIDGRTALVVDDGMATGSTARAAVAVARAERAARVVLAVPVASAPAIRDLREVCDLVLAVEVPPEFRAVGEWYDDFSETTDDDVERILSDESLR